MMSNEGKLVYAHRLVYELHNGPIPSGYEIDHRCNQSKCLNPEHLEALSPEDHDARHRDERERKYGAASSKVWNLIYSGVHRRDIKRRTGVPLHRIDAIARQIRSNERQLLPLAA